MVEKQVVEVESRQTTGKNAARRMRREGKVPGIVYGLDRPPFSVAVGPRRIEEVLKLETGRNTILTLTLAGQDRTRSVMIRELQRDPVDDAIIHVDFVRVDLARVITVKVPVRIVGTPIGVKADGGILEFLHREIEVECLPTDIPEHLDVDVSHLHINQHVSVSDLAPGEKVKILTPAEEPLAVVAPPRLEEVAPAPEVAEAVPAEPEVIKKGKEAEPGEEGPVSS
jgi:large subunit ribosomal protein L25